MQKSNEDMIRIALVDDHEVVRQGLKSFLKGIDDFSIVGEGATAKEAVAIVKEKNPHILLLDMILPDRSGLEAMDEISTFNESTKILFLSSFSEPESALPALRNGAAGYLLKDISPRELAASIREVYKGAIKVHPDISALMINALNKPDRSTDVLSDKGVTDRESDVIKLIGKGLSNKEIASVLNISQLTVKTHVSHILDKMGLDDRTQVAIFAVRNGLAD